MRADRLLSILMILQANGRATARQLAEELEVSIRTIYRDIDALGASGVPVYFERGKNGGCVLLEGYRTNLTGLTPDEIKALFILGIPASLDELGVSRNIKTALQKLSASLPPDHGREENSLKQRIYIDWTDRQVEKKMDSPLRDIYTAVWENRKICIRYLVKVYPRVTTESERTVKPYGLVAKSGEWYLVCDDDKRIMVLPLSSVLKTTLSDEEFTRPVNFSLPSYWAECYGNQENHYPALSVSVRISPVLDRYLSLNFDRDLNSIITDREKPDENGYVRAKLQFDSFEDARTCILDLGNGMEVLEPEILRLGIIDYALQIKNLYEAGDSR